MRAGAGPTATATATRRVMRGWPWLGPGRTVTGDLLTGTDDRVANMIAFATAASGLLAEQLGA